MSVIQKNQNYWFKSLILIKKKSIDLNRNLNSDLNQGDLNQPTLNMAIVDLILVTCDCTQICFYFLFRFGDQMPVSIECTASLVRAQLMDKQGGSADAAQMAYAMAVIR